MADGWMGLGAGMGGGVFHAHTHTHTHMYVKDANHAKHGCLHVSGHLQFLYMYTCIHVWGNSPPCPKMPPDTPSLPAPSPELQGAQNTKIQ